MAMVIAVLQLQHQLFNLARGDGVEGGAGLVHQQHFRLRGDGAGDAQPLLLSAGKGKAAFVQLVLDLVPQGRALQGLFHLGVLVSLVVVQAKAEGHVIINAGGERIGLLEHHADKAANGHRIDRRMVDVFSAEVDVALKAKAPHQIVHPVEAAQNRALAASGRANKSRDVFFFTGMVVSRTALKVP